MVDLISVDQNKITFSNNFNFVNIRLLMLILENKIMGKVLLFELFKIINLRSQMKYDRVFSGNNKKRKLFLLLQGKI